MSDAGRRGSAGVVEEVVEAAVEVEDAGFAAVSVADVAGVAPARSQGFGGDAISPWCPNSRPFQLRRRKSLPYYRALWRFDARPNVRPKVVKGDTIVGRAAQKRATRSNTKRA